MTTKYYDGEGNDHISEESVLKDMKISASLAPSSFKLREFALYRAQHTNPYIEINEFKTKWAWLFNYPDLGKDAIGNDIEPPFGLWVQEVALNPYADVDIIRWLDREQTQYEIIATIPAVYSPNQDEWLKEDGTHFIGRATEVTKFENAPDEERYKIIKNEISDRLVKPPQSLVAFDKMTEVFELLGVKRNIPDWIIELRKKHPELGPQYDSSTDEEDETKDTSESKTTVVDLDELADGFEED